MTLDTKSVGRRLEISVSKNSRKKNWETVPSKLNRDTSLKSLSCRIGENV